MKKEKKVSTGQIYVKSLKFFKGIFKNSIICYYLLYNGDS